MFKFNKNNRVKQFVATFLLVIIVMIPFNDKGVEGNSEISFQDTWYNPLLTQDNLPWEQSTLSSVSSHTSVTTLEALKEEIANNMYDRVTSFTINYQGDTSNIQAEMNQIFEEIFEDHYLKHSFQFYSWSAGGYVNDIDIEFNVAYITTKAQEDFVDSEVTRILGEIITPDMNDHQKVKAVNDYIVANVAYDETYINNSAYAALAEGTTVCNGYALLAYKMLQEINVEILFVVGDAGEPHGWNLVKIDGNWYHLDTTWNDPTPDVPGRILYNYYNLTDDQLAATHFWERNNYPTANTVYYQELLSIIDNNPDEAHIFTNLMKGIDLHYVLPEYTAFNTAELEEKIRKSLKHKDLVFKARTFQDVLNDYNLGAIYFYDASLAEISYSVRDYTRTLEEDILLELYFTYNNQVTSLTVTDTDLNINSQDTHQLDVTAIFADSTSKDITSLARYEALNSALAEISESGLVTALAPGETEIKISYGGIEEVITLHIEDGSLPEFLIGDVTVDGSVNVNDAITILQSIVGNVALSERQTLAADVNGDGRVDVGDAIMILRYVVGLITW